LFSRSRALGRSGSGEWRYLPVVRWIAARVWPARRRPVPTPLPSPPRTGGGVRRMRRRSAWSRVPSSARSLKPLG
jgi:hypothetical protein